MRNQWMPGSTSLETVSSTWASDFTPWRLRCLDLFVNRRNVEYLRRETGSIKEHSARRGEPSTFEFEIGSCAALHSCRRDARESGRDDGFVGGEMKRDSQKCLESQPGTSGLDEGTPKHLNCDSLSARLVLFLV